MPGLDGSHSKVNPYPWSGTAEMELPPMERKLWGVVHPKRVLPVYMCAVLVCAGAMAFAKANLRAAPSQSVKRHHKGGKSTRTTTPKSKRKLDKQPTPSKKKSLYSPKKLRRRAMPMFESVTRARKFRAETASTGEVKQRRLATYARSQTADVLQAVPGLQISQHTGRGKAHQFFLRGFDAIHGSDLEIRVQGIPINEVSNIHGQGYADINFLPGLAILRMRYLKGPFLGRQGDFATTGSLEFDLGLEQRGLLVQGSIGSFWRREATLAWGPKGMGRETFVVAEFSESNGFGENRGWLGGKAMAQALFRWRRYRLRILASGYFGRFGSAGVLRQADLDSGRISFYDAQRGGLGGYSGRFLSQGTLFWKKGQQSASFMGYAILRDLRLKENFTGHLLYEKGDTFEQQHSFVQIGSQGRWQKRWFQWGRTQQVQAGIDLRHDRIDQAQYRLTDTDARHTTELDAEIEVYQLAAWLNLKLRPWRWLKWSSSLRITMYGLMTEDKASKDIRGPTRNGFALAFAPRTSLSIRLHRRWKLFLAYGQGYRSVQARSLSEGARMPLPKAHNAEVGVRLRIRRWVESSFALFGIYMDQELVFDHATATNLYAGTSWRFGGEWSLRLRLFSRWLWLDSSVTYSEGFFVKDQTPIPFAPRLLMRQGIVFRWRSKSGFWRVLAGVRSSLVGARPLPYGLQAESAFLLSAVARLQAGKFFLRVDGRNLLNAQWKDGQFVYSSAFYSKGISQKLPQLHYTAGHPLEVLLTVGATLF